MKAIKGILFDKDGTLLDYDESWLPVNRELARIAAEGDVELADRLLLACGMDPVTGHIIPDSLLAAGNTRQISEGLIAAGSKLDVIELTIKLDELFSHAAEFSVAVTDLAAFFSRLHSRGFRLGVASSDNERSIRQTALRFGFAPFIDYVAGYDSGFGTKPEPGMVLGFCAATGLDASEVAVVGDNNHDLHMGRNAKAGITVAVLTGTGSRESLAAASDYCLNDITELERLLPDLQLA
ncbi:MULTISPECIES: HAD family hydrolase [unclassified Rhizobium]|uniref:HAD family hydrolase n=1 Tax=unclassified Rhizobium TaxID=2613769 RepID=UPI001610D321|nr:MULTISPECIES: HAD family hydrolase [unclassified Rhizobium]MBB3540073.1 phosphoglycolate phosphatase [Rhizobium sp. BK399]MCS3738917.1 phosphoglycolate phosphatase [Rhizobium sp. BK661]MCS4090758.1 phosphoglycolate phosphatase [Rhizobium sp. BK176]